MRQAHQTHQKPSCAMMINLLCYYFYESVIDVCILTSSSAPLLVGGNIRMDELVELQRITVKWSRIMRHSRCETTKQVALICWYRLILFNAFTVGRLCRNDASALVVTACLKPEKIKQVCSIVVTRDLIQYTSNNKLHDHWHCKPHLVTSNRVAEVEAPTTPLSEVAGIFDLYPD